MSRAALDIGIIGAGTAGLAAAIFLARAGHAVTVYERVPTPGPVGAGLLLQPTGQSVLRRLGLLPTIAARGAHIIRLRAETDARRTLLDLRYAEWDPSAHGIGLHRGVLFEALLFAARAEPRVHLHVGVEVTELALGRRHAVVDTQQRRHGQHQLIVVADGAGSRALVPDGPHRTSTTYPWGALWAVLPDPQGLYRGELYQVVRGTRRMVGFLPTGLGPPAGTSPVVSLFWSLRGSTIDVWKRAGLAPWKDEIMRLDPRAEGVLGAVSDVDQLLYAGYRDVVMDAWHDCRGVAWLGDAGHATSPQLGQGANLALWDAHELHAALATAAPLSDALAMYTRNRRAHLAFYQFATRWPTPFFQHDGRVYAHMRDVLMPIANGVPWVRRRMVRSMAGVERGPLPPLGVT